MWRGIKFGKVISYWLTLRAPALSTEMLADVTDRS
jgi:hypothetical protein